MAVPREVAGWCPLHRPCSTDDELFEALTAAVFEARFRPTIVRQRWPAIRRAFASFDVAEVGRWPDSATPALLEVPGMIRSPKKVLATLRNAREVVALSVRAGSALRYLRTFEGEALVAEVDGWAHDVGAPSIRFFLRCAGLLREPQGRHRVSPSLRR